MRFEYSKSLGREVSVLTLGTLGFAEEGSQDAVDLVRRARECGVNAFDSADVYGDGEAERVLGRALRGVRDEVVISTKIGLRRTAGRPVGDLKAREIVRRAEASLARLGTDRIDILLAHAPDESTRMEETVEALAGLVQRGIILAYGWSNFPAEQLVQASMLAQQRGTLPATCVQCQYSILVRTAEASVLPVSSELGLDAFVWGPLASGWLTEAAMSVGSASVSDRRRSNRPDSFDSANPANAAKLDAVARLVPVARDFQVTVSAVALSFALFHPAVTSLVVGPRSRQELAEYVSGVDVHLDESALDFIDSVVAPGAAVNPLDVAWLHPALVDSARRRRSGSRNPNGARDDGPEHIREHGG